ncbi:MAG: tetraacyldisaccharide 4'-kinase [Bacteroidales bacterium]|nr:tetraacyldisaccharide 4'-kinase [Bacteroidales bacterium]
MNVFSYLLMPLAWLYDAATRIRNARFDSGSLPSRRFGLPVIAIGNLAVGGTGKTPHTEYVVRLLRDRFRVAILSRGYGRRSRGYVRAAAGVTAAELGDEPFQMWQKFPDVAVAVDADRCEGIDRLLAEEPAPPQAIVLDDAFQHRYVCAGLYVLLTDYSRLYTSDFVLPAGRLRESRRGARRAHVIIVTKCPAELSPDEAAEIRQRLRPQAHQAVFFTTFRYGKPYKLFPDAPPEPQSWAGKSVFVPTGIARPTPLHQHVEATGGKVKAHNFGDHHNFTPADVKTLNAAFEALPPDSLALTTEKDAARFALVGAHFSPRLRAALLVQPIEVAFLHGEEETFKKIITDYVTENQANR